MIIYGSYAAQVRGVDLRRRVEDLDILGSAEELEIFERANDRHLTERRMRQEPDSGCQFVHFSLKPSLGWSKIEFHLSDERSDQMLIDLCTDKQVIVLNSPAYIPSTNILYLTKRSHLNFPKNWDKHFWDMLQLMKHIRPFSEAETAFYKQRREEAQQRFSPKASRFTLSTTNEEFFKTSNHIRKYVHDDIHKAIAFEKGKPMFERCKRDLSSAKLDEVLFRELPYEEQLKLPQEEFFVIGIERFYINNRSLPKGIVYANGLKKTVRDLSRGWFQDFCLDNMRMLAPVPRHEFIEQFESAERNGELRLAEEQRDQIEPPSSILARAEEAARVGKFRDAQTLCNEVLRTDPANSEAFRVLGSMALGAGRLDDCERLMRNALKNNEANWKAWNALGIVSQSRGDNNKAIGCYRRAIGLDADHAAPYVNLGMIYERNGQLKLAISAFRDALAKTPNHPAATRCFERVMGNGSASAVARMAP